MLETILWVLAGYWGFAWIAGYVSLRTFRNAATDELWQCMPVPAKLIMCLVFLIGMPIALPFCWLRVGQESRREKQEAEAGDRAHIEYQFDRLHPANLPGDAADYFDRHTDTLLMHGFQQLGNYLFRPEPHVNYGRCFLSDDGTTLAILCRRGKDEFASSYVTLFADEFALETSTHALGEPADRPLSGDHFVVQALGHEDVLQAYQQHVARVRQLEEERQEVPLCISAEQLDAVVTWYQRIYSAEMYRQRLLASPPPAPTFPTGRPRRRNADTTATPACTE